MTAKAVIYSPFLWDSGTEQQPEQAGGFHAVYGGEVLKRPDFSDTLFHRRTRRRD